MDTTNTINVIATVVSAIATAVIGFFSWKQYGTSRKQQEISERQQKISEEQVRLEDNYRKISQKPLIIIPYSVTISGGKSLTLQIQNTGTIPVHNITFFFNYEQLSNNNFTGILLPESIKTKKLQSLDDYSKLVRISELCPQRGLISAQQLNEDIMKKIVDITNHNTKLDYAQKASNSYQRLYFMIYGAIKYKGTNDIEEDKQFFELVEFIPEYNNFVKDDKGKMPTPKIIPANMNFLGRQYPAELSTNNRETIKKDLDFKQEF